MAVLTSTIINELKGNLRRAGASQRDEVIKKALGLSNRPEVFSSESLAISAAKNQARTTKQSVEVLRFVELPGVFAVASTNHDAGEMKRAGFVHVKTIDAAGGSYQ